jgi:hypothetical protein
MSDKIYPTETASRIANMLHYPSEMFQRYEMNRAIFFAGFHKELTALYELDPSMAIDVGCQYLDIVCNNRKATVAALQTFASPDVKWDRNTDCYGHITYTKELNLSHIGLSDHVTLTVAGTPPPSCTIVEEEVPVPATTRKVKRIICSGGKDDVQTKQDVEPEVATVPEPPSEPGEKVEVDPFERPWSDLTTKTNNKQQTTQKHMPFKKPLPIEHEFRIGLLVLDRFEKAEAELKDPKLVFDELSTALAELATKFDQSWTPDECNAVAVKIGGVYIKSLLIAKKHGWESVNVFAKFRNQLITIAREKHNLDLTTAVAVQP